MKIACFKNLFFFCFFLCKCVKLKLNNVNFNDEYHDHDLCLETEFRNGVGSIPFDGDILSYRWMDCVVIYNPAQREESD